MTYSSLATHHSPLATRRDRRGATMIVAILMIIALLGLAGLTIDLGGARLTQAQMRSASEAAALEALRGRDSLPPALYGDSATNPVLADVETIAGPRPPMPVDMSNLAWEQWLNHARRILAQRMIDYTYSNYVSVDPDTGEAIQRGAGPVLQFDGGMTVNGGLVAHPTVSVPADHVYRPQLDVNLDDDPAIADMAAGMYQLNGAYPTNVARDETIISGQYLRRDFEAANGTSRPNAFLIRLRRTSENPDPRGRPIPYLFGQGSLLNPGQFANGITVRAPAIAAVDEVNNGAQTASYQVGRVKAVGRAFVDSVSGHSYMGLAPFTLVRSRWDEYAVDGSLEVTLTIDGDRLMEGSDERGRVIDPLEFVALGRQLSDITTATFDDSQSDVRRYVPIYDTGIVLAFGYIRWDYSPGSGATPPTLTLRSLSDTDSLPRKRIGNGNVTASVPVGTSPLTGMNSAQATAVFTAHRDIVEPLLAPVLVNRNLGPQTP